jgi:hypothetical protein
LAQGRWGGEVVDLGVVMGTEGGVVAEVLGAEISSIEGWIAKVLFRVRAAEEGMAVWRLRAAGGGAGSSGAGWDEVGRLRRQLTEWEGWHSEWLGGGAKVLAELEAKVHRLEKEVVAKGHRVVAAEKAMEVWKGVVEKGGGVAKYETGREVWLDVEKYEGRVEVRRERKEKGMGMGIMRELGGGAVVVSSNCDGKVRLGEGVKGWREW